MSGSDLVQHDGQPSKKNARQAARAAEEGSKAGLKEGAEMGMSSVSMAANRAQAIEGPLRQTSQTRVQSIQIATGGLAEDDKEALAAFILKFAACPFCPLNQHSAVPPETARLSHIDPAT